MTWTPPRCPECGKPTAPQDMIWEKYPIEDPRNKDWVPICRWCDFEFYESYNALKKGKNDG